MEQAWEWEGGPWMNWKQVRVIRVHCMKFPYKF